MTNFYIRATNAPQEVQSQLKYAKASIVAEYVCGAWKIKIRAAWSESSK